MSGCPRTHPFEVLMSSLVHEGGPESIDVDPVGGTCFRERGRSLTGRTEDTPIWWRSNAVPTQVCSAVTLVRISIAASSSR